MRKDKIVAAYILGMIIIPRHISQACKLPEPAHLSTLSKTENDKDDAAKLFEGYPKSGAFDHCIDSHLDSESNLKGKLLLYATWFLDGRTNVEMDSVVDVKGKVTSFRNVYNWSIQNIRTIGLNEAQLEKLNKTLLDLPKSTTHPPIKHLLIFSFCMKGKWITRTYDTSKLPQSIVQIYQITEAPLEKGKRD